MVYYMNFALWALILISQNFSFVLVSRARNSNSILYHGVASLFSNGIWFAQNFILVTNIMDVIKHADWVKAIGLGLFYMTFTMMGALSAHIFALHYEKKKGLTQ